MDIVRALFLTLGALAVYVLRWGAALYQSRSLTRGAPERAAAPGLIHTIIGFATNFFDTLGIGSFATTTSTYKTLGGRSYAAGGRAGVCVHQRYVGRPHAARLPHHRHDGIRCIHGLVAAMRFVSSGRYVAPAAIGLTVGGIPGVLIAVWLVKSLPLDVVRWGVSAV